MFGADVGIADGGADGGVAEEFLQDGKVNTDLQEMGGKRVPQGVRCAMLGQTGGQTGVGERLTRDIGGDWLGSGRSGEQPQRRTVQPPVITQNLEQSR